MHAITDSLGLLVISSLITPPLLEGDYNTLCYSLLWLPATDLVQFALVSRLTNIYVCGGLHKPPIYNLFFQDLALSLPIQSLEMMHCTQMAQSMANDEIESDFRQISRYEIALKFDDCTDLIAPLGSINRVAGLIILNHASLKIHTQYNYAALAAYSLVRHNHLYSSLNLANDIIESLGNHEFVGEFCVRLGQLIIEYNHLNHFLTMSELTNNQVLLFYVSVLIGKKQPEHTLTLAKRINDTKYLSSLVEYLAKYHPDYAKSLHNRLTNAPSTDNCNSSLPL